MLYHIFDFLASFIWHINNKRMCARIATGNFDAVIIGHSQLIKIPLSAKREQEFIQNQINEITESITATKNAGGANYTIKELEKARAALKERFDKLVNSTVKDSTVTFEELGIDKIFVDEAHEFKNLFVATKLQNVAGISNSASQKALDLFLKCRYLDEKTGGKGVIFATGTPLSNSIRKEAAKALEDAVLAIKYADTPVKVGSFQGFDLSVTVNSNMMGGGMSAGLQGATSHTTKLIESFAHNLNRLEAALYNIDGRIERTQDNLAKLRLDHAEAQKIVAEPFPQQEELDTKEQRLKVVTDELNQAAIEAKKNAPKREKTCYFERAKMKRDAARLGKKPKTPKDQTKGRSKKQGIE